MKAMAWLMVLLGGMVLSNPAGASGSIGSGGYADRPQRQADPLYELGKAVVKGKTRDYGKIKYCLAAPGSDSGGKLRGKTAKQYRKAKADQLALALYNCDSPEQKMVDVFSRQDLLAVIHYLNVRYKLKLTA